MKRVLLFFVVIIFQVSLYAQHHSEVEASEILNKVMQLKKAGNYQEGFLLCEQLMKEKLSDKETTDVQFQYVQTGYHLAISFMKVSCARYADARKIFASILPYAELDTSKRIMSLIPSSWFIEGIVYQREEKYDEALSCLEEAYRWYDECKDTKKMIDVLCKLGEIRKGMNDFWGALDNYHLAGSLCKSDNDDAQLMSIFINQRQLCNLVGDTERSYFISFQMDSLLALTNDEKVKFEYYIDKGGEAKAQSRYRLSEKLYLKNNQYIRQLDDKHNGPEKYIYYNNLCDLYTKAGRYEDALFYAELVKKENQLLYGSEMAFMSAANIYSKMGDSIKCFQNIDSLFLSFERVSEPLVKSHLYITRANCHSKFKNFEQALADYKKADEILATRYDEGDSNRIKLLAIMGGIENKLKHYDVSEQQYRSYAEKTKVLYGEKNADYLDAVYYLANAEAFAGHIDEGCKHYSYSIEKTKTQIREKLPFLTTVERENYWNEKLEPISHMTPFAIEAKKWQTSFTKDCYDGLILTKAFLLESERSTYDLIKKNGTKEDRHDFELIASMQAKIKYWERDYDHHVDSIHYITSKADVLEKQLTNRCRSYGDMTEFMSIGYQKIKAKLNDGDILIDFTDFVSQTRGRVYAAYIIENKQEFPLLKELFEESVIDSMQIRLPNDYYSESNAKKMLELLWSPLKDYITEGAKVYYVPTQLLFQIALESLPMNDGSFLGEHYQFIRLSSAREIVNEKAKLEFDITHQSPNAVLYGGLKYSLSSKVMEDEAAKYDIAALLAKRGDVLRGYSIFDDLPDTKNEIDEIQNILKSKKLSVVPYSGINGTEESFMNMHGKAPQLLHIATHGFYYTPDLAQKYEYLKGYTDAMSLSGLVMSGGNAAWSGKELPEGVLGGILTATNISRLDLSGIQLAVLSACKTGRGEATPEGLFGLQRAFKKAGAQTLIMSLWSILDIYTKEFMVEFYKNLASNGWHKRNAFQDAKKTIRDKYKDPYFWAGFVMLD